MESDRTPVQKVGPQNYQCPDYDNCVGETTAKEWPFFTCSECLHKLSGTGISVVSCSTEAQVSSTEPGSL